MYVHHRRNELIAKCKSYVATRTESGSQLKFRHVVRALKRESTNSRADEMT
jgi:hypothetical protein